MEFDTNKAKNYVGRIDLTDTPRFIVSQDAATEASEDFDKAKAQAQVVGSGVFSFAQGVTTDVREAISDSALLAQLVANQKVPRGQSPLEWFKAYADVLLNVGWVLQDKALTDFKAEGNALEVHEAIINVLAAVLGPIPAALVILTATVKALKSITPNSSWLTIFNRESQHANIARFQIGLVEKGENDEVFVSLFAYLIEAKNVVTQVLFFKFRTAKASCKANSSKVSINRAALAELQPVIRKKVRAFQNDYLSTILNV